MRARIAGWILMALGAAPLVAQQGGSQGAKLLLLPMGHTHVLERGATKRIRIPVFREAGTENANIEVDVLHFHDKAGRQSWSPIDFSANINGNLLEVVYNGPGAKGLKLPAGEYDLILSITAPADGGKTQVQTLALVLKRSAPQLALPKAVVLQQTREIFGPPSLSSMPASIALRETSGGADLNHIRAVVVPDTEPASATLKVEPDEGAVNQGAELRLALKVAGTYPLGVSKGRIDFVSNEIPTQSVNYEVHARLTPWWIPILAVVGVLLGYGLRVLMKQRQDLAEARLAISEFNARVVSMERKINDAQYRERIGRVWRERVDLQLPHTETFVAWIKAKFSRVPEIPRHDQGAPNEAATRAEPAQIMADAVAGHAQLDEIQKEFYKEYAAEWQKLEELNRLLDSSWRLPEAAGTKLQAARTALSIVREELAKNDLVKVGRMRNSLFSAADENGAILAVVNAALNWHFRMLKYLEEMQLRLPPLSAVHRKALDGLIAEMRKVGPPAPNVANVTAEDMKAMLNGAHNRWASLHFDLLPMRRAALEFVYASVAKFPGASPDEIKSATEQLLEDIENDLKKNEPDAIRPGTHLETICAAWSSFLTRSCDPKVVEECVVLMKLGMWPEAIDKAAAAAAARRRATEMVDLEGIHAGFPAAARSVLQQLEHWTAGLAIPASAPPATGTTVTVVQSPAQARRDVHRIKFVRSFMVAVIFIAVAGLFYWDKWVGTPAEIGALLLLAFSTDLTVDSLTPARFK